MGTQNVTTLNKLPIGTKAKIVKIAAKGDLRRRLTDMGVILGTELKVEGVAPLGDPIEVKVLGYRLSLRKSEAALIEVEVM
ncbi:ferrous iron transport protein A [Thermoanaerobacter brockii subsp. lactiethylicus]|jgi:ferrous iron transport protein A|uniref:FeoA family protein n=1 Tax=Thermoanaerobacter italicus (strain DSM 9252 / Ab9) TaxID=580331 RepID=D3T3W5_THEIA|nr:MULTISPECIES: ferrous iron transport protein A [Thermoanaerobacter]ABY92435.1 FeoA family protein [Thermoanaerobacter sp. X514]ADD02917.1 FeoA family protein [Thermoanaerobacter italicus Ab9]